MVCELRLARSFQSVLPGIVFYQSGRMGASISLCFLSRKPVDKRIECFALIGLKEKKLNAMKAAKLCLKIVTVGFV